MEVLRATESSTDTSSSSYCFAEMLNTAATPLDFGEATWAKRQQHSSSSADSDKSAYSDPDPDAAEMQKRSDQFVEAIRRLLPSTSSRQKRHRQLDVPSLNRSLANISRSSYQQGNSCPYDATSRWVDLTVRIKRENPVKVLRDYEALQRLRRENQKGVKMPSSRGDADTMMNVWTRQFRMRADPSRLIYEALQPLLARLGYSDRRYSVTVNGFAQAPEEVAKVSGGGGGKGKKRQAEEVGLLYTIGSLAKRGASEIFVNFDFDLR